MEGDVEPVVNGDRYVAPPARRRRRPNRFDRPPEPHDWRWVVGGVGRFLITLGLLMFAFVAYQLWGTGIATAQEQSRLAHQFNDVVAANSGSTTTIGTVAPAATDLSVPVTAVASGDPEITADPTATTPPTTAAPTVPPTVTAGGAPPTADVVFRLEIPKIGADLYVVEGVSSKQLGRGPGHFPETPMPGQFGNAAVAGHRTTHGAPFGDLEQVQPGDQIFATNTFGQRFTYNVTSSEVVEPSEYAKVIPTTDPTRATLTLATCTPRYTAQQRLIVFADLVLPASPPPVAPPPLPAPTYETIPGDNPEATTPAVSVADGSTTASNPTVLASSGPAEIDTRATDAFAEGWFSDHDALPQVALWGVVVSVIAAAAYAVSRRFRRNWLGALAGIAPFIVCLYFFYENVNRLLPPGL